MKHNSLPWSSVIWNHHPKTLLFLVLSLLYLHLHCLCPSFLVSTCITEVLIVLSLPSVWPLFLFSLLPQLFPPPDRSFLFTISLIGTPKCKHGNATSLMKKITTTLNHMLKKGERKISSTFLASAMCQAFAGPVLYMHVYITALQPHNYFSI